jgi:hypothetical protein
MEKRWHSLISHSRLHCEIPYHRRGISSVGALLRLGARQSWSNSWDQRGERWSNPEFRRP